MRKICYLLLCFIVILKISSQTYEIVPSTFSVANASVADNKYYSVFQNPASTATLSGAQIGVQYENKYIINALAKKSIYLTSSTNLINLGISATYSGYELHNELLTGILLSKNFNNIFQLGVQYNYYSVYLAEANKRYAAFFPQIGLIVKISPSVNIGFSTFNPGQQAIQLKYVKKQIPTVFSLGADWKISENLNFLFQTDKNVSGNYRVAGGFEYDIKKFITFKTGAYHIEYLIPTVGFGLKLKTFDFCLNTELHPILGLTTCAAIQYSISKK
jgi:hypothetical protein